MRRKICTALLVLGIAGPCASLQAGPVVVELFTSQGCSSCPPADELLGRLKDRADVLALSLHVDYWDGLGWEDPFGQHRFSERQRRYASRIDDGNRYTSGVYTPQVVVDGERAVIGHAAGAVHRAIESARSRASAITPRIDPASGSVVVPAGNGATPDGAPATVWLIRFDPRAETEVARGENAGRTLVNHNVVRRMEAIGEWTGERRAFAIPSGDAPWRGIAVLVQRGGNGAIVGAAMHER